MLTDFVVIMVCVMCVICVIASFKVLIVHNSEYGESIRAVGWIWWTVFVGITQGFIVSSIFIVGTLLSGIKYLQNEKVLIGSLILFGICAFITVMIYLCDYLIRRYHL